MATYGKCVCGKRVSETKSGVPRAHICNAPGGPEWAVTAQPVVPADVDETDEMDSPTEELLAAIDDPFTTPTATEFTERTGDSAKGPWVEARYANTLDCGHDVLAGDEIRADGEGGWECRDCGVDQEEASYATPDSACTHPRGFTWADDGAGHSGSHCELCGAEEPKGPYAPAANWNGTGRPRPSASTVKLPEPAPQEDKPRLLDTLREAQASVMGEVPMPSTKQRAAAGLMGLAGQVVSAAQEAVQANGDTLRDAFTTPTPQGSGPRRGAVATTAATASRPETADPFSSPTHVAPPLGSATDQPETERDRYGRYVIKDPRTGDFKRNGRGKPQGFTRATTYGKTLLDQFGIHQWEMRSVLAGLALRPDLVRAAQGLDVTEDRDKLNEIAASAKDAAGGNEAASDGTEFHTVTEWMDTGRMEPRDAPEKFRAEALAYAAKMQEAGLATRPEWIERVTFTDRGGEDVAGTADRILVERNGQHVVGDVKSGKGIDLAQREIAIQLKVYAMGINQFGLYNKATQQWEPWTGPPVSEDYGIVMHVPVVRPGGTEAYCDLYRIDLRGVAPYEVSSAMHAAAWVREWRKQKGFASPYHAPAVQEALPAAAPTRTWKEAFTTVNTPEEANRLWQAATDAGMGKGELDHYVSLARLRLERLAGTRVS